MLYQSMHLSITCCLLAGFKMSGTPRNKDSYICQQASGCSKSKAKEEKEKKAKQLLKKIPKLTDICQGSASISGAPVHNTENWYAPTHASLPHYPIYLSD